jgi:hypothetical protein
MAHLFSDEPLPSIIWNPDPEAPAIRITLSCPIPVSIVGIIRIGVSSERVIAGSSPVTPSSMPSATSVTTAVTTSVTAASVTATPSIGGIWNSYNGHYQTKHHDQ